MRNANVFPDPVLAAPRTSFPASRGGIARAWTDVIFEKPISDRAFDVFSESSRSENGVADGSLLSLGMGMGAVESSAMVLFNSSFYIPTVFLIRINAHSHMSVAQGVFYIHSCACLHFNVILSRSCNHSCTWDYFSSCRFSLWAAFSYRHP